MRIRFFRWLAVLAATGVAVVSVRATVLALASGSSATTVQLVSPTAAVPTADGGFLLTDEQRCTVSKVSSNGTIIPVAGNGTCGESGDNGPATAAELSYPTDAVPTSDGGFLIAEGGPPMNAPFFPGPVPSGGGRIRAVSPSGTISTVAGDGTLGDTGDNGPATSAEIDATSVVPFNPPGAAVQTPGSGFLIADYFDCVVRRVDGSGTITTVAGGTNGCSALPLLGFNGVSCTPSTTFCVAVGDNTPDNPAPQNVFASADPGGASPSWTPANVDNQGVPDSVSCPSSSLCVGVDETGNVVTSTNPGAATPNWTLENIDGSTMLDGVSCPSSSLCVAVDAKGNVLTSTDPGAAPPTWTPTDANGSTPLDGVSCASSSLCVAVGYSGSVVTSTDPGAPTPTWTPLTVSGGGILLGVSCPSSSLCAAVGGSGNVVTSSDPSAATPTWTLMNVDGSTGLTSVSCSSSSLCVATDFAGNVLTSVDPGAATPAWTLRNIDGSTALDGVSCPSASLCVAVEGEPGRVLASTDPGAATPTWTANNLAAGDGGPATSAYEESGYGPISAVPTADGGFLISEGSSVRKVSAAGTITTVAGDGCCSPDGGPATSAALGLATSAVPTPDGGFLISDYGDNVVRKVSPSGTISTVAGNGQTGIGGNGGSATSSPLTAPSAAVPLAGGGFLIGSYSGTSDNYAVVRDVSASGTISTVAGMKRPHFTLEVSEGGTGAGGVSSSPSGIACPHVCKVAFPGGTSVTLSAKPAKGSVFSGWRGSGCSGIRTCVVAMTQARSVTATFSTLAPVCAFVRPSGAVHVTTQTVNGRRQSTGSLALSLRCSRAGSVRVGGVVRESRPAVKSFAIAARTMSVRAGHLTPLTLPLPSAAVTALTRGARESAVLTMLASDPKGSRSTATRLVLSVSHQAAADRGARPDGGRSSGAALVAEIPAISQAAGRVERELWVLGRRPAW